MHRIGRLLLCVFEAVEMCLLCGGQNSANSDPGQRQEEDLGLDSIRIRRKDQI